MTTPSIFTKIINGEIPSHKIYEDELTYAFLDIHPIQPGHVLVVPRAEVEFVWDLSEKDYGALMSSVKRIAERLRNVLHVQYVGAQVVGVDVPHAHVHLIPFTTVTEFKAPQTMSEPDHAALAALAAKLRM